MGCYVMKYEENDAILKLLRAVHGNPQTERDDTLEEGLHSLEDGPKKAHTALRALQARGNRQTRRVNDAAQAISPVNEAPNSTDTHGSDAPQVVSGDGADFIDAAHVKTLIIRRPKPAPKK